MGKLVYIGAGLVAFILAAVGNPLWVSLVVLYPWIIWVFFGLGIGLLGTAGAASMIDTSDGILAVLGLTGFAFTLIWFLACFPEFATSLI